MIENRECERWHRDKGINVIIYDEMICAGYYGGGKDSCQGDSGGPLMTEIEGRWTLIGIVSAGYSCAKRGQPGIYHRVAQTSDWISYSINDQKNKKEEKNTPFDDISYNIIKKYNTGDPHISPHRAVIQRLKKLAVSPHFVCLLWVLWQ